MGSGEPRSTRASIVKIKSSLGPADQGRAVSAEVFAEAEFAEPYRYERVNERLVVMSPSGLVHTRMISALLKELYWSALCRDASISS